MGADLITYSMMVPTTNGKKIIQDHVAALDKALALENPHGALKKLGVDFEYYGEQMENNGAPDTLDQIRSDLKDVRGIKTLDDMTGRDTSFHTFEVNGVGVACVYAGEMSWGDEPEGYGYTTLAKLGRLGFGDAFYKAIPWDMRKGKEKRKCS